MAENDKPTASEIGAASFSHIHNNYITIDKGDVWIQI